MYSPKPATIENELFGELDALLQRTSAFHNEGEFAFFFLKAKKLVGVDAAAGHTAYAFLYHLCGNAAKMRYHLENAGKLAGSVERFGYWCAFEGNLGFATEAQKHFAIIGNPTTGRLSNSFDIGLSCGAFSKLGEYLDKAVEMKLDLSSCDTQLVRNVGAIFADAGVADERIGEILDVAGEVMRERQIVPIGKPLIEIERGATPSTSCVFFTHVIARPGVEVADISYEFADRLISRFDEVPEQFFVTFRPGRL